MTNAAAIGYMILAAKRMRLDKMYIAQMEANMRSEMDFTTEEEAEEAYKNN
jgi:hypothetical protein